ncbi:Proline iminopeptidase [Hordeum vulgare]|nr:Proline iminopeptidase [Hordeum vulgare]
MDPLARKDLYPQVEPFDTGRLRVSDVHTIYYEQSGNPGGQPVVFLHGGPGAGTSPGNRRFFDPQFYRIVLFDQRGAGKSTPHACLHENTTWDLVADIEKLRQHLDIPEWQAIATILFSRNGLLVFGGSWGSTLALAYSQTHPDKVTGIVLRGIFLLRKKELDWFYEGGAAAIFPDAWEPFRDFIPEDERNCFIAAYSKRLTSSDADVQIEAAKRWTMWEMMTAHLIQNHENIKRGEDDKFSLASTFTSIKIENHYFINKGFLDSGSHLLDNIDKIRHIKAFIVQLGLKLSLSSRHRASLFHFRLALFDSCFIASNKFVKKKVIRFTGSSAEAEAAQVGGGSSTLAGANGGGPATDRDLPIRFPIGAASASVSAAAFLLGVAAFLLDGVGGFVARIC